MSDVVLLDPSDNVLVTFQWTDMPAGATLSGVVHSVPSPLVKGVESTNAGQATSTVKVGAGTAVHGQRYMLEAQATLSNGEVLNRQVPVLVWNA
jgi:hypothetical protein